MNELALFAGAGGGILGGHLLGWRTVAAVEVEDYPRRVLLQRQADGILPRFPVWDDVCTFDGKPWRGKVDVISGGFPCQDISAAGKGAGIEGERSGLWGEMARIINEVRPRYVFAENSPLLVSRGLGVVLRDLAKMGYDAKWGIVGAHHVGAPHKRDRIWIRAELADSNGRGCREERVVRGLQEIHGGRANEWMPIKKSSKMADSQGSRLERQPGGKLGCGEPRREPSRPERQAYGCNRVSWWDIDPADVGDADSIDGRTGAERQNRQETVYSGSALLPNTRHNGDEQWFGELREGEPTTPSGSDIGGGEDFDAFREWRATESELGRVAHGVVHRVDRLKAIGNGQVPAVAAYAWRILHGA